MVQLTMLIQVAQCGGAICKVQKTDVAKMSNGKRGVGNGERARKLENEK